MEVWQFVVIMALLVVAFVFGVLVGRKNADKITKALDKKKLNDMIKDL